MRIGMLLFTLFSLLHTSYTQIRHTEGVTDLEISLGGIHTQLKGQSFRITYAIHQPFEMERFQLVVGICGERINFLNGEGRFIYNDIDSLNVGKVLIPEGITENRSKTYEALYVRVGINYLMKEFYDRLYLHTYIGVRGGYERTDEINQIIQQLEEVSD